MLGVELIGLSPKLDADGGVGCVVLFIAGEFVVAPKTNELDPMTDEEVTAGCDAEVETIFEILGSVGFCTTDVLFPKAEVCSFDENAKGLFD